MKDLSLLPNKEGFEFIAVLKNGDIVKSKVIKDENGVHRFPEFSNSIGWLDLKIKAFRNRKTFYRWRRVESINCILWRKRIKANNGSVYS